MWRHLLMFLVFWWLIQSLDCLNFVISRSLHDPGVYQIYKLWACVSKLSVSFSCKILPVRLNFFWLVREKSMRFTLTERNKKLIPNFGWQNLYPILFRLMSQVSKSVFLPEKKNKLLLKELSRNSVSLANTVSITYMNVKSRWFMFLWVLTQVTLGNMYSQIVFASRYFPIYSGCRLIKIMTYSLADLWLGRKATDNLYYFYLINW